MCFTFLSVLFSIPYLRPRHNKKHIFMVIQDQLHQKNKSLFFTCSVFNILSVSCVHITLSSVVTLPHNATSTRTYISHLRKPSTPYYTAFITLTPLHPPVQHVVQSCDRLPLSLGRVHSHMLSPSHLYISLSLFPFLLNALIYPSSP